MGDNSIVCKDLAFTKLRRVVLLLADRWSPERGFKYQPERMETTSAAS